MKHLRFFAFFISIFLSSSIAYSSEQERILDYFTKIEVNEDGSMNVSEHIKFFVTGENIKLGIYREIPKSYYINGRKINTTIDVLSVERDGKPEHFWVENTSKNKTIQIGDKEDYIQNRITPGVHDYVINWKTKGHIRGFETYDEIYFNAIGTQWNFPIEVAKAEIILPQGFSIKQLAGYYGADRSTEKSIIEQKSPNIATFYAPNSLSSHEGLTISVGFEKGLFEVANEPNLMSKLIEKIMLAGSPYISYESAILILITFALFIYYMIVWYLYGKDDVVDVITPQFYPPKDVSFLDSSIIWKGRSLNIERAFYASLIDLASKGNMEIDVKKGEVRRLEGGTTLYEYETSLLKNLFKKATLSIKKYSHAIVDSFAGFTADIKTTRTKHIKGNKIFILFGFIFYIAILFIMPDTEVVLRRVLVCLGLTAFYMPFFFIAYAMLLEKRIIGYIVGSFVIFHYLAFFFGLSTIISGSTGKIDIIFSLIVLLSCIIHYVFYILMDKPLPNTVKILGHLQGLHMYMNATDKEVYMKITPEIFEKNLPYAILFGIEDKWFEKLKNLYPIYSPDWYKSDSPFDYGSIRTIHQSLSKASINSSKSSSSGSRSGFGSSSGSGGGGSSGGGSGGGGGGGR